MNEPKTVKTWQKTKVQNLVKHKSGTYYARIYSGGKESWKSLKTKVQEVAKAKLRDELKDRGKVSAVKLSKSGRMTMDQAIQYLTAEAEAGIPMRRVTKRVGPLRASSAHYRKETLAALCKSWEAIHKAALKPIEVRKVTRQEVKRWADKYRNEVSPTRFNNTLGSLRRLFDIAIQHGELHQNPSAEIERSALTEKKTVLPTREQFLNFVATIRKSSSRVAPDSADFVDFLAFTGARKGEAWATLWRDVHFETNELTFQITKTVTRTIPMIAPVRALLERIKQQRESTGPNERVLKVKESQGSMDTAATKIKMERITHHDLRKLFATTALECGADVLTVADWLGHQDGGKLLQEVYRKTRQEHSASMAGKVTF